jgi:hypothetical protein
MDSLTEIPAITSFEYLPYLEQNGSISEEYKGKIGVYAIFALDKKLQFIGYSRDIYLSLKQHLVRQPQQCYWLKATTITRPSRTILEEIRQQWLTEIGEIPPGNSEEEALWTQPIDAKIAMTEEEKSSYQQLEELAKIKFLKQVARRVESELEERLKVRGSTMEMRFNPKLKEQGLLDLK